MSKSTITLSQALEGYFLDAHARRLSPNTLDNYEWAFRKFERFLKRDPPFPSITSAESRAFQESLHALSKKSVRNVHSALSALWTWGVKEGVVEQNVVREVRPPKPERRAVIPFTKSDAQSMLSACDRSQGYVRPGKRRSDHGRPTALRDRAILKALVDTGLRATELCELRVTDADLKNRRITVWGKGDKQRYVKIGPRATKAIWRYLATREDAGLKTPLFATANGMPMDRNNLRRMIKRLGERAGVPNAHPHRFRHTFAVNFLRNGGNIFALKQLLGHSSMKMVEEYLHLAQADIEKAHQDASPVENWLL